ncbi:hypothetical protein OESDEN_24197, partial [Oesophagostomum dentatum]
SYPGDWRPRESVSFANCRVLQATTSHPIHKGDIIEALFQQQNGQAGWQKASVREIKADFIVVDSVEGPQHTDVVAANKCRSNGAQYLRISPADLRTDTISMLTFSSNPMLICYLANFSKTTLMHCRCF